MKATKVKPHIRREGGRWVVYPHGAACEYGRAFFRSRSMAFIVAENCYRDRPYVLFDA